MIIIIIILSVIIIYASLDFVLFLQLKVFCQISVGGIFTVACSIYLKRITTQEKMKEDDFEARLQKSLTETT